MRVVVHPADLGGCGTYRLILPAQALAIAGLDVTLEYDKTYSCVWRDTMQGPTVVGLAQDIDADVIVIQRPLTRNRYEMIGVLQDAGHAVVVEVDDDFHAVHSRNPAWRSTNPLTDPEHNRDWLMRACQRADLVTVTTPALAERYGAHGRVVVLPNFVPERYLTCAGGLYTTQNLPRPPGVLVGWSGSVLTHPGDLNVCGDGIARALDATGAKFHVIGTGVKVADALGLTEEPTATSWLPIFFYPEGLAQLDIAIVPLDLTIFNSAKSALKMMEMISVGVPAIGSPTPDNRRLVEAGVGWLAESPGEWYEKVVQLVNDPTLREDLSLEWQDRIRDRFTIEKNAHLWLEAWESSMSYRRARVAA